ncbi:putative carboxylesterase [Aspergillus glaucus CBS 516.65]|uniref:Carboxylic ester hydrolase n=1 Tax=Aspergillus glaucus CBS 516.65 TaxID=1160497 RepID=A0A1L9VWI2_ASPGL|nr:hypothetical protein ASPGLDRAFT_162483 [Aspergillus glaucus CBS 516.65]OJJ88268.1 hypothetical protein ASPGLDRAFT_162483 [Aspergillus glaucus CBS 516.65]
MAATLKTTSLGEIRGKDANGATQYLGIKYATLKNRFADAELIKSREADVLDATRDGPTAVSPLFGCDLELSAIQHTLPKKDLQQSDVDCLNLNITVSAGTTASSKLPVFIFIHGGGFMLGANSWPQFDYGRFVRLSKEKMSPVVAVSINYRLGAFGFLTSDELRKAGYNANNGLRDQRVALEWVQKHIQDFGGDPGNVTVAGESAGAASVTYHLHSEKPLFKRAIVMSGSFFLLPALPYDVHEENYKQAIAALGLENATPEERIRFLLETPGQDLIGKLPPSVRFVPAFDGDIVPSGVTYTQVGDKGANVPRGKTWCDSLLVGDTQMDTSIMAILIPHTKQGCANKFTNAINTVLSSHPSIAQQILHKYNITPNQPDEEAFPAILNYLNDLLFFAPTLTLARGWPGAAYVYYFNEGNPWDGPWKNRASHILDVAYLFQNFREYLTPEQKSVGAAFAEDMFKYCHGIAPWPAIKPGETTTGFTARTYGPSADNRIAGQVSKPYGEESQRRSVLFEYDAVSLDDLVRVFVAFTS